MWPIDNLIPLKDKKIVELVRGAVIWSIWLEKNRNIFRGGNIKSYRSLDISIINLVKYLCQMSKNNSYLKTQLVLLVDVERLYHNN